MNLSFITIESSENEYQGRSGQIFLATQRCRLYSHEVLIEFESTIFRWIEVCLTTLDWPALVYDIIYGNYKNINSLK